MNGRRRAAARAALDRYRGLPFGDRFQVHVRWRTCPMAAVEAAVPRHGRILDLGCGHGLLSWYLAATGPDRSVLGVDIDPHKVELARRTSRPTSPHREAGAGGEPSFQLLEPGGFAPGPWDAIVVADVLYLLPAEARRALLARSAAELAPGGVLVIKEVDRLPRWKYRLTVAQELVSTRVLRITAGDDVDFAAPAELAAQLEAEGLAVQVRRVDRGYPHPHVLVTAIDRRGAGHPGQGAGGRPRGADPGVGGSGPPTPSPAPATAGVVQPADAYFDVMASVAEQHWWYRGRRALVRQLLGGRIRPGARAVDVGCGTGETLGVLEALGAGTAVGTDLSTQALGYARTRHPRVLRALAEALPFRAGSAGCLVSMDVVEHLDDDVAGLREYVRVLEPGAPVLLTAPAYRWLWSEHDELAAHRRRYTVATLRRSAEEAGIVVERTTHFYSFLVPPAALLRCTPLRRLVRSTDDEASAASPSVNAVCSLLARIERALLRRVDLPVGLSVALVGRAPSTPTNESRPHSDHGDLTPTEFAQVWTTNHQRNPA